AQHLARAGLAPVAAVGRDRERLRTDEFAPDAAGEAEAVAADAAQAGLVVIGRAEPGSRRRDHPVRIGRDHSTLPSCPPSLVAYRRTASCPGICGKPLKLTVLANFLPQVSMRL